MKLRLKEIWYQHAREEKAKPGNEDYKLTYRDLEDKSGITIRSIRKIENDQNVTIETLEKLARFFKISVCDLLDENHENGEK